MIVYTRAFADHPVPENVKGRSTIVTREYTCCLCKLKSFFLFICYQIHADVSYIIISITMGFVILYKGLLNTLYIE